jgi:tetratricopeptide (TPR) repeat protein
MFLNCRSLSLVFFLSSHLSACHWQNIARDLLGSTSVEDQAIRSNPQDANAYFNRGTIRAEHGNRRGAIEDFTEAIRIISNDSSDLSTLAGFYDRRAQEYRIIGNKRKALSDYQEAARIYKQLGDKTRYELVMQDIYSMI